MGHVNLAAILLALAPLAAASGADSFV